MVSFARRSPADITPVKFCFHCGRDTVGEPSFCNFCGRSYDVKLCPKLHANPRGTRVCSKCGSAELSTPQPRVSVWARITFFLVTLIPRILLALISIGLVIFFLIRFFFSRDMLVGAVASGFTLGALLCGWIQIPLYFRKTIHRWWQRHGKEEDNK